MLYLTPSTPVASALAMIQHKIYRHLPLMDGSDKLISMVDIRDLLLAAGGERSDQPAGEHVRSLWTNKLVWDVLASKRREKIVQGTSLELYLRTRANRHTIEGDATIEAACQQMARENLTFLVVLETPDGHADPFRRASPLGRNKVIGLVNERNFLVYGATRDVGLHHVATEPVRRRAHGGGCAGGEAHASLLSRRCIQVKSITTPLMDVVAISPSSPVSKAVDIFFEKNVRHLPVISPDEHLYGVISLRDVLRPILPAQGPGGAALGEPTATPVPDGYRAQEM